MIPRGLILIRRWGLLALVVMMQGPFAAAASGDMQTKAVGSPTSAALRQGKRTVWDGLYSEAQAIRGQQAFARACSYCHGRDLEGSDDPNVPSLSGRRFLRQWSEVTVAELFNFMSESMPQDKPGSLSPQTYIDILSFVLKANKFPAGDAELEPVLEKLQQVLITEAPPQN